VLLDLFDGIRGTIQAERSHPWILQLKIGLVG
jgi:hypothetical protein